MKSLFIKTMAYSMFILLFMSCKKDETKVVAGIGTAPVLTSTQTSLVLSAGNAAQTAAVFSWTASSFGYSAGVSYAVQIDVTGNNFKAPKEIALGQLLTKTYTVGDLNDVVNQLGLTPGAAGSIDVRIKASISDNYTPAYSNVFKVAVTPYLVAIVYPSLYVPGSYQGWAPATAAKVSSVAGDQSYEGYVNFPDASTQFKFTSDPDFNHVNYGTSAPGTLNAGGGDNLTVTGAGYYLLKANTKTLTYSATKAVWAMIGDAAGSWDADTPMTYDVASGTWTVTKALVVGSFKFRANGAYDLNFGVNKDGKFVYGGDNIPVTVAGTYKVVLNLSVPGNYTYNLIKQ